MIHALALCLALRLAPVQTNSFAQEITCLMETGSAKPGLRQIERLGDGRGETLGPFGLTTSDEEPVECVEDYTRREPRNHLAPFLPLLRHLRDEGSGDTRALRARGFEAHWRNACSNPAFVASYALIVDRKFGVPARFYCARLGLQTPVAYVILFDSLVQHGNDRDGDGVPAMIARTGRVTSERAWLGRFLDVRRATLLNPRNRFTRAVWRQSVSRVAALKNLLWRNPQLRAPVHVVSPEVNVILK